MWVLIAHMNKKKTMLGLVTAIIAILGAGIMTGAINLTQMPEPFIHYLRGDISGANMTVTEWNMKMFENDIDVLVVNINCSITETGNYFFNVTVYDSFGMKVESATGNYSFTADEYQIVMFTLSRNNIVLDAESLNVVVTK